MGWLRAWSTIGNWKGEGDGMIAHGGGVISLVGCGGQAVSGFGDVGVPDCVRWKDRLRGEGAG